VARHIASQPVTVTERDTVPRPSRHIRPSLEGGVNVTGDRWNRRGLEQAQYPMNRDNSRIRFDWISFPRLRVIINRMSACWRPSLRDNVLSYTASNGNVVIPAADLAHTLPTRPRGIEPNPSNSAISGTRPHDRWSRDGKRSAGQTPGEAEALAISDPQFSIGLPLRTGGRCRRTRLLSRRRYSTSSPSFAAPFQKPVALPPQRPGVSFPARLGAKIPGRRR
jgi:hypothetical protein